MSPPKIALDDKKIQRYHAANDVVLFGQFGVGFTINETNHCRTKINHVSNRQIVGRKVIACPVKRNRPSVI